MTFYSYPITIEKERKQYYAYSDDFPGVYGLGKTVEEAKRQPTGSFRQSIPLAAAVELASVLVNQADSPRLVLCGVEYAPG